MKISRMRKGEWGKVRAFFDVETSEGFTLKGFKLVEGISGLFVGFPSAKGNDGDYHDMVWLEKEPKVELNDIALQMYNDPTNGEPVLTLTEENGKPKVVEEEDIPF